MHLQGCSVLPFMLTLQESSIFAFGKMSYPSLLCISFIKTKGKHYRNAP